MSSTARDTHGADLLRFLWQQASRFKGLYFTTLSSWSVVYALPLAIGSATAALIDKASGKAGDPHAWYWLGGLVAMMLARSLVLTAALQCTFKLIYKTSAWLKIDILERLLRNPSDVALGGSGEILNRLRDDTEEIGGLLEWTTDLIYRTVLSIFAVSVLAATDVVMVLPLGVLLGGLFISVALKKRVAQLQAETRRRQGNIGAAVADTVGGIRDLRLAAAVEDRMSHLVGQFAQRRSSMVRQQLFADLLSDLFRNLVLLGTSLVLLTMSLRSVEYGFDVGKLVLFLTYTSWLGQQMYFFGKIFARFQNGKVSYARLQELIGQDGAKASMETDAGPLLELSVEALTYQPSPGGTAPLPVSFRAKRGDLIALTGDIGAGKTRIVRGILGLEPAARGKVFWNGSEVSSRSDWMRFPRVSYAGQSPRFLRGTLEENVALGVSTMTGQDVERALSSVHLEPGSAELAVGVATKLDSGDAGQLSGGQRQRLALARMLSREAELYVVDDCDSSLDASTARLIWQEMRRQRNAVWIVVSQNPTLLELADQVITLKRGEPGFASQKEESR